MGGRTAGNYIQIEGRVDVAALDVDGSVLAVNVVSRGQTFLVDDTPKGERLLSQIGKVVQVSGHFRKDGELNILAVENYRFLSDSPSNS